ncbi:MAG: phage terminase small subunit P27 family [Alphaproteobacteria bacterium]|nr:phage terminase small subunit P27 family [Alphaproteobacteria bacterium]
MPRGRKGRSLKARAASRSDFRAPDKPKKPKLRSAEDRAALLASCGPSESLIPPDFMAERVEFDGAIAVWKELAPDLERIGALAKLDRYTFAIYCVHMADWINYTRDIAAHGETQKVKTVSGDQMERLRPSVKMREIAERRLMDISERFGLNPAARFKMLRDEALVPDDLFTRRSDQPQPDTGAAGALNRAATPPPGQRPN